jgi:hypothetical protein
LDNIGSRYTWTFGYTFRCTVENAKDEKTYGRLPVRWPLCLQVQNYKIQNLLTHFLQICHGNCVIELLYEFEFDTDWCTVVPCFTFLYRKWNIRLALILYFVKIQCMYTHTHISLCTLSTIRWVMNRKFDEIPFVHGEKKLAQYKRNGQIMSLGWETLDNQNRTWLSIYRKTKTRTTMIRLLDGYNREAEIGHLLA